MEGAAANYYMGLWDYVHLNPARPSLVKGKSRSYARSKERLAHGEKEAGRLLKEVLSAAGLRESELVEMPANEKRKVEIARAIWSRTTVSQGWIAERLKMRRGAHVSLALHSSKGSLKQLPVALQESMKMQ